jgi:hypothetical protein
VDEIARARGFVALMPAIAAPIECGSSRRRFLHLCAGKRNRSRVSPAPHATLTDISALLGGKTILACYESSVRWKQRTTASQPSRKCQLWKPSLAGSALSPFCSLADAAGRFCRRKLGLRYIPNRFYVPIPCAIR